MYLLGGLLLIGMGLLMLLSPETFFDLTEGWKSNGASGPSRLFLLSTRTGGVFVTAAGVCGIAAQFL